MDKTLYSEEYAIFLKLLKEERSSRNIFQSELSDRLGEHQSFVSKVEGNVRRLDIIEAMTWCRALGVDWRVFQDKLMVALEAHSMAAAGGTTTWASLGSPDGLPGPSRSVASPGTKPQ